MLTGKQRAGLRSAANKIETIGQIGHGGITPAVIESVGMALKARELVKYKVLETSPLSPDEAADALAEALSCEVIQVIGCRIVLFLQKEEDSAYEV